MAPFFLMTSQQSSDRMAILDKFFGRKDTLCLYWCRFLCWLWICLCNASAKPPSMDLENPWPTTMVFHTVMPLTRELTSQPEKWIHWSYNVPHHSEATGLIKSYRGILKKQREYKLGGSILEGWPGFSRRQYLLWINVWYMVSPIVRDPGPRNQDVQRGNSFTHFYP